MQCAAHPDVETNLSCSKCLKPICPKCLVETPVGPRCHQCAHLTKLPTFNIMGLDYFKAVFVGLASALVFGIAWLLIKAVIPFISLFNFLLAAAAGYGIGQAISLSVRRKRSRFLKIVASFCMFIAFIVGNQFTFSGRLILDFNLFNLLAIAVGIYLAISQF